MATFFDSDSDSDAPSSPQITRIQPLNAPRPPPPATAATSSSRTASARASSSRNPASSRRYDADADDDDGDEADADERMDRLSLSPSASAAAPARFLPPELDPHGDAAMRNGDDGRLGGAVEMDDEDDMRVLPGTKPEHRSLRQLAKRWVAERACPSLLRWEGALVDGVMFLVEQQNDMVLALLADASEDEHFQLMLVQAEIERAKFLLRSYLRCRLAKVEKFAQWIVATPTVQPLLSGLELAHARRFNALVASHYTGTVLSSLPESLRQLDAVSNDGMSMVSAPNDKTAVFIYCTRDLGSARLPSGEEADFAKGTTHLVRWGMIEHWVRDGRAELI